MAPRDQSTSHASERLRKQSWSDQSTTSGSDSEDEEDHHYPELPRRAMREDYNFVKEKLAEGPCVHSIGQDVKVHVDVGCFAVSHLVAAMFNLNAVCRG
jgi:hypothetical protein